MANTNASLLTSHIYKSRKIVLELMDKQGYDVNGYANFSINEVNSMKQNNQLDMLLESKSDSMNKRKVYIRYYLAKTMRPTNIQEMIDDLFNITQTLTKEDTLYIIMKDTPNETLVNELKDIWERDKIFIIIEGIKYLQFNILENKLVPKHEVLNDNDLENIMKKYNISNKSQFPDISRFDPVSRAIGLRPGQLCHILRPSKTSIMTDYYRICV